VPPKNPNSTGRSEILDEIKNQLGLSLRGSGTMSQARVCFLDVNDIAFDCTLPEDDFD